MANNTLSQINQELEKINRNAVLAERALGKLHDKLQVELFGASSPKSSAQPTYSGIQDAILRMTQSGKITERTRLGGEARMSPQFYPKLLSIIKEVQQEVFRDLEQSLTKAPKTVKVSTEVDKEVAAEMTKISQMADKMAADIIRQKTSSLRRNTMPAIGGSKQVGEEVNAELAKINQLADAAINNIVEAKALRMRNIVPNIATQSSSATVNKEVEEELAKINKLADQAVASIIAGKTKPLTRQLDRVTSSRVSAGEANRPETFTEEQKSFRAQLDQVLGSKGLTEKNVPAATGRIKADINALDIELAKLGNTLTSVAGSKMSGLGNGLQRLDLVLNTSQNAFQKLTYYVDAYGNALTTADIKQKRAAQSAVTPESAKQLLGFRADRAFALAGKSGFQPETLEKVTVSQPANIAKMTFAMQNAEGVTEKMTVTVDKLGNALARTSRRELGFTQSLIANTAEMFKWSIGAMLIYGAYEKMGQLITTAIENQTRLADVTVALGSSQRDVNAIFRDAADIAGETGESINDVLDSYTAAYRAVGGVADQFTRTAAANQLLTDATVLNKLSTLDSTEAIDVLSGSLRQAQSFLKDSTGRVKEFGTELAGGEELLNDWVKVTRVANVDMSTLATAFSVTAESALNAGVSVQQLNAIIASLSEKIGGLGGKETGNAVRALIGGVYQEQAATALNQYGIAVQDVDGRMRNFLDISRDIFELYRAGIIDDTQLNKLGYTLGGGVRRGQQYVAFLKDQERIQAIVNEQTNTTGEAQRALQTKTETLQTANTRLGNSFQTLAQTLGTKGGFLDSMTLATTGVTGLVDGMNTLVGVLGKVTVPATLLAVLGAMSSTSSGRLRVNAFSDRIGNLFGAGSAVENMYLRKYGQGVPTQEIAGKASRLGSYVGGTLPGIGIAAGAAYSELAAGNTKEAGITFAAGVTGALVGSLGGPVGAMIGSTIGTFIAQTFATGVRDHEAEFEGFFNAVREKTAKEPLTYEDKVNKQRDEAVDNAYKLLSKRFTGIESTSIGKGINTLGTAAVNLLGAGTTDQEALITALQNRANAKGGPLEEELKSVIDQIKNAGKNIPNEVQLQDRTFYTTQENLGKEITEGQKKRAEYIDDLAEAYRKELYEQYKSGEVSAKDYRQGLSQSFAHAPGVLRVATGLKVSGQQNIDYGQLSETMLGATEEDSANISAIVGDIEDLSKIMDQLEGKSEDTKLQFKDFSVSFTEAEDLMKQKNDELNTSLALTLKSIQEQAKAALNLYSIVETNANFKQGTDIKSMQQKVADRARELQRRELDQQINASDTDDITAQAVADAIAGAEPIFVKLGKDIDMYLAEGILDSKYIQQAIEELVANAELQPLELGYQFMDDVTKSQFDSIMPQYDAIRSQIEAAGGTTEETPLLTFFKDSSNPMLMTKDWRIVQYLLQEILKVNEKQLDGMYNLPSGASFYVPFQAWAMDKETRQASAEESFPTEAWDQAAYEQYTAGMEVQTAAGHLQETVQYWYDLLNKGVAKREDVPADVMKYIDYLIEQGTLKEPIGVSPAAGVLDTNTAAPQEWIDLANKRAAELSVAPPSPTLLPDQYVETGPTGTQLPDSYYRRPEITSPADDLSLGDYTNGFDIGSTFIQPLISELSALFQNWFGGGGSAPGAPAVTPTPSVPQTNVAPVQTNLNVQLESQTQLIVDGRVLADIVKPYLYNDLVSYENSAGTVGSAYVAA